MTSHEPGDDPVVRAALGLLPIPEHREGFWDDLELALAVDAAFDAGADRPSAGARVARRLPDTSAAARPLLPPALRRRSNAALLAVAVAALVVVVVAGQSLLANRTGSARRPAASAELEALVDRSQPADTAPEPLTGDEERAVAEAVLAWVAAVASGDAAGAWEALGPDAQGRYGTRGAFESEMSSMADAFAPWASGPVGEVVVTPVGVADAVTLAVVTLSSEGAVEAVPVRLAGDEVAVEPTAAAGLELVVPAAGADTEVAGPLAAGDELLVVVPIGASPPLLRIDEGSVVVCGEADGSRLSTLDDGSAQRCAYLPPEGLTAGRHTLTVAFRAADRGSLAARSVLFDAA